MTTQRDMTQRELDERLAENLRANRRVIEARLRERGPHEHRFCPDGGARACSCGLKRW